MVVGEYIFRKNQSTVERPEESDRGIACLVFERCPVRSKQYQELRSIVQFPFSRPRVALTLRNKIPFSFVTTVDCAFRCGLGGRNKHLPRAGQTLFTFHGNHRISPYLAARGSSEDVMSFDPHRGRNCRRTCCENNTHQNDSCFHGLTKRCTTMGECINRDNCLKQFPCLRGAMSGEGPGSTHTGLPRAARWGSDAVLPDGYPIDEETASVAEDVSGETSSEGTSRI